MVYTELESFESNGISNWLKQESTQLIVCSLMLQMRKLQSIDKFFLATTEGLRDYEAGFEHCQLKR